MKRAAYMTDLLASMALVWLLIALLPLPTIWFDPQILVVQDSPSGTSPKMGFTREIKRPVTMRYTVLVRDVHLSIVCESRSGAFQYKPDAALPAEFDLDWWTAGDCATLPVGTYVVETCWTATDRFFGILPDRTVCVASNTFKVW